MRRSESYWEEWVAGLSRMCAPGGHRVQVRSAWLSPEQRVTFGIDGVYCLIDPALNDGDFEGVDFFLSRLDPEKLVAPVICAVLIATLGAKTKLVQRAAFIERSRPVLSREPEGIDAVLKGLL